MTKRITEIENKIIECKKAHTYLEKCKFVLSYKIQELKKEAGPMEKVLEDLQKRTKEDELSSLDSSNSLLSFDFFSFPCC